MYNYIIIAFIHSFIVLAWHLLAFTTTLAALPRKCRNPRALADMRSTCPATATSPATWRTPAFGCKDGAAT
jgi:hypothetical protein